MDKPMNRIKEVLEERGILGWQRNLARVSVSLMRMYVTDGNPV